MCCSFKWAANAHRYPINVLQSSTSILLNASHAVQGSSHLFSCTCGQRASILEVDRLVCPKYSVYNYFVRLQTLAKI